MKINLDEFLFFILTQREQKNELSRISSNEDFGLLLTYTDNILSWKLNTHLSCEYLTLSFHQFGKQLSFKCERAKFPKLSNLIIKDYQFHKNTSLYEHQLPELISPYYNDIINFLDTPNNFVQLTEHIKILSKENNLITVDKHNSKEMYLLMAQTILICDNLPVIPQLFFKIYEHGIKYDNDNFIELSDTEIDKLNFYLTHDESVLLEQFIFKNQLEIELPVNKKEIKSSKI